ncbi:MAG: hypothetical protein ACRCX2_22610 [Paraclostridium sp.]
MKSTKTATEWLAYIKLEGKKLKKRREELAKSAFEIRLSEKDAQVKKEDILSSYDSIKTLEENIFKVRDALSSFNSNTFININGKNISLANALHIRKTIDSGETEELAFFKKIYKEFTSQKLRVDNESRLRINELERTILNKANATKTDREMVDLKKKDLEVVILDPLNIEEKLSKLTEENDEFMTEVDVKINLVNATSNLTIDLKD